MLAVRACGAATLRLGEGAPDAPARALLGSLAVDPAQRAKALRSSLLRRACPGENTLAELAGVAGLRWTIETCFGTAKRELGLIYREVRFRDG